MVGDGAVVSASSTKDHYAFGESNAARKAFAGRTIDADLAFLVPFLKPGLSLVDCGCGGGGLAVQLSERRGPRTCEKRRLGRRAALGDRRGGQPDAC
jgi:hypothetical protein